jgi:hypothetical protein
VTHDAGIIEAARGMFGEASQISMGVPSLVKNVVWISYDLGVRGDYDGLYAWLDRHNAKECGDSLAFISYEYKGSLPNSLKADLKTAFKIDGRTRIYVIYEDDQSGKFKGKFIFGHRKQAPWAGYAPGTAEIEDVA